jgi:hypothetical protein
VPDPKRKTEAKAAPSTSEAKNEAKSADAESFRLVHRPSEDAPPFLEAEAQTEAAHEREGAEENADPPRQPPLSVGGLKRHLGLPLVFFDFVQDAAGRRRERSERYTLTDPRSLECLTRIEAEFEIRPRDEKLLPNGRPAVKEQLCWLHDYDSMVMAGFREKDVNGFWVVQVYWGEQKTAPANVVE